DPPRSGCAARAARKMGGDGGVTGAEPPLTPGQARAPGAGYGAWTGPDRVQRRDAGGPVRPRSARAGAFASAFGAPSHEEAPRDPSARSRAGALRVEGRLGARIGELDPRWILHLRQVARRLDDAAVVGAGLALVDDDRLGVDLHDAVHELGRARGAGERV